MRGIVVGIACAAAFGLGFLASKHVGGNRHRGELQTTVRVYCNTLQSDLDAAAETYQRFAASLDGSQLAPDSRAHAEAELLLHSIGTSADARGVQLRSLQQRIWFCIDARQLQDPQRNDLQDRAMKLLGQLGASAQAHSETARQLTELAHIAQELNSHPYLE